LSIQGLPPVEVVPASAADPATLPPAEALVSVPFTEAVPFPATAVPFPDTEVLLDVSGNVVFVDIVIFPVPKVTFPAVSLLTEDTFKGLAPGGSIGLLHMQGQKHTSEHESPLIILEVHYAPDKVLLKIPCVKFMTAYPIFSVVFTTVPIISPIIPVELELLVEFSLVVLPISPDALDAATASGIYPDAFNVNYPFPSSKSPLSHPH